MYSLLFANPIEPFRRGVGRRPAVAADVFPRREASLQPLRSVGFGHTYGGEVRYSGETQAPQRNKSNRGQAIMVNRQRYERGVGVHAPCELVNGQA